MTKLRYRITAIVAGDRLGEFLTTAQPLALGHLQVVPVTDDGAQPVASVRAKPTQPRHRDASGSRPTAEVGAGLLVMEALATGACTLAELQAHVTGAGYAINTTSATLSKLKQQGAIERRDDLYYIARGDVK